VPLADLMAVHGASMHGPDGHRYYASAWAFVHQLIHAQQGRYRSRLPAALRAFQQVPHTLQGIGEALTAVYPERTLDEIEHEMFADAGWMETLGTDHLLAVRFPRPTVAPTTRPADPEHIRGISQQLVRRLARP
jgi:hypothetical protein